MKNRYRLSALLLIVLISLSCSEENLDKDTVDNYTNDACIGNKATCCGINGRFKVLPGRTYTYTEITTVSNATVTWTVESGAITLISSQGSTAVFKFNSSFTTGRIRSSAVGSSGIGLCECVLDISKQ